jgi:putative transposase
VKKSNYTEEQIAFALKQAELGRPVAEVCRKPGISDATFYNWRKKFGGLGPLEVRRLKQLEEENAKLKRLVADLSLDKAMLQDVLAKRFKAFPQTRARRRSHRALWRQSAPGMRGAEDVAVGLQLPLPGT